MGRSRIAGPLSALAAAFLFSTGGAAIKAASFTSWQVAGSRSAAAACALLLLVPAARRRWNWRVAAAAPAYAATMVMFVAANKLTTAANAIFLQSSAPFYLLLLGPLVLHEKARARDLAVMAAIGVGMAMFFVGAAPPAATAPDPARGNVIALASGLAWALTLTGIRWISGSGEGAAMPMVVAGNVISFLFCLPLAVPFPRGTAADWLTILYLGVFQIGLAYVCLAFALRRLPALEVSLLLLAEPALNPVWAWAVHGERPGVWALAGGALILAATSISAARQNRSAAGPRR